MHERVCLNGLSLPKSGALDEDLETLAALGATRIGVHRDKVSAAGWSRGLQALLACDLRIEYLVHRRMFTLGDPATWPAEQAAVRETLEGAAHVGAPRIYGTTGPAGELSTGEATRALAAALAPVLEHAADLHVAVCFEVAHARHAGIHFLHRYRDGVATARAVGARIALDVHTCHGERGIEDEIAASVDVLELVQVNDARDGTEDYAVPGEGDAPVAALVSHAVACGYAGPLDVKIIGGSAAELERGARWLDRLLADGITGSRR